MRYDGLDPATLASRLGIANCICRESVTSTLDVAHELGAQGEPAGTVILADEQTKGRGRQGRYWHSPRGAGIWLGYLLRPDGPLENAVLALRTGLAVVESLRSLRAPAMLKWPNDVVLADRKLAGVLCEARWSGNRVAWIAVGIGINVHGPFEGEIAHSAIALDEVLPNTSRVTLLEELAPRLARLTDLPALTPGEHDQLEHWDWLSHRRLVEPVAGEACGIDEDGALLVQTDGGITRVLGGSVVAA